MQPDIEDEVSKDSIWNDITGRSVGRSGSGSHRDWKWPTQKQALRVVVWVDF